MRNDYLTRARKFSATLVNLFEGCVTLEDFENAIDVYNHYHARPLSYDHGVSRITIIRSDYVIKFDYQNTNSWWGNGRAGSCESEEQVYRRAVEEGMSHLLAETTVYHENDLTFSIMPRIKGIGLFSKDWTKTCTLEEEDWLWSNIRDLHEYNIGYRHGKVCVIDYAWENND